MPAAQFPDFANRFDQAAPASLAGCSPPFLSALPEPGTLQIWTGLMARTATDWSLLIRAPANLPSPGGFSMYEGIVEADRWFGPLFTNLRFTRTNVPVRLRADFPLAQVQPLPRVVYADLTLAATGTTADMAGLSGRDWPITRIRSPCPMTIPLAALAATPLPHASAPGERARSRQQPTEAPVRSTSAACSHPFGPRETGNPPRRRRRGIATI
jgi:hypothetical protein